MAMPHRDDMIDKLFREAIKSNPEEAKSHFELVDPGVWRFDVSGRLSGLGTAWVGPYRFVLDGVKYDAFGLRSGIVASQVLFLEDLGVCVLPQESSKRALSAAIGIIACLVVIGVAYGSYILYVRKERQSVQRAYTQAVKDNQSDVAIREMLLKAEQRKQGHEVRVCQTPNAIDVQQKTVEKSIKERARDAFRKSQWDDAIALVDQLSEEEADAELRYYIGICYKEGYSVDHSYEEAFYWFKSAAELGNAAAQYELGLAYEKGNGVSVSTNEAIRWYGIAAKSGNAMANLFLGLIYDEGRGVVQNPSEASRWYRTAVDLGNAHAGYLLGRLYYEGRGVAQSYSTAAELFRESGSLGHAQAGFLLGEMYEKGIGVGQNKSEALYWYKKAGEHGNSAAMSAWQRLSNTDKMWIHPK